MINVTYDENYRRLYLHVSFKFCCQLNEFPTTQNYKKLLINYNLNRIVKKIHQSYRKFGFFSMNQTKTFNLKFDTELLKKKFGENLKFKFIVEKEFEKNSILKSNVFGISQAYEKIKEVKNYKKGTKKILNNKNIFLGKKTSKVQLYWIKDKVVKKMKEAAILKKNFFHFLI